MGATTMATMITKQKQRSSTGSRASHNGNPGFRIHGNGNGNGNDEGGLWANAILEATAYAFDNSRDPIDETKNDRSSVAVSSNPNECPASPSTKSDAAISAASERTERVDRSLVYLEELRRLLGEQDDWDRVPINPSHPPRFLTPTAGEVDGSIGGGDSSKDAGRRAGVSRTQESDRNRTSAHRSFSNNPYATIAFDDSDDDSDEESDDDSDDESQNNDPGNGTNGMADPDNPFCSEPARKTQSMDTVRLLIRLHASLSDLHAQKARLLGKQRLWVPGAGALQSSIVSLAQGLELADVTISKALADTEASAAAGIDNHHHDAFATDRRREQLEKDADIVSVSTRYLVFEKDRYLKTAYNQAKKLERILEPMYKKRDEAKRRIGADKWKQNPNSGNGHFWKIRIPYEQELRALEEALRQLEDSRADAFSLVDEASQLRDKLREIRYAKNRHNMRRPTGRHHHQDGSPGGLSSSYPDPTSGVYGWTFTGSLGGEDCVEFYEKWFELDSEKQNAIAARLSNGDNGNDNDNGGLATTEAVSTDGNHQGLGSFVLVQLDFHSLSCAVRTSVEYPALRDNNGKEVRSAFRLPLYFNETDNNSSNNSSSNSNGNLTDPALYGRILMDPWWVVM